MFGHSAVGGVDSWPGGDDGTHVAGLVLCAKGEGRPEAGVHTLSVVCGGPSFSGLIWRRRTCTLESTGKVLKEFTSEGDHNHIIGGIVLLFKECYHISVQWPI